MKYCEEYAALLDLYVDGELTAEETLQVEAHLGVCADCRAYVDDALAMHAAFAELGEVEVPEGFAEAVCAAITPRKAKKTMHWGRTLASLAACCAVVILLRYGPVGGKGAAEDAAMEKGMSTAFDFAVADAEPAESVMEETEAAPLDDAKKSAATMTVTANDSAAYAEAPKADEITEECMPESAEESVEQKQGTGGSASVASTEFSLLVDGCLLTLGVQSGSFPWRTTLTEKEARVWSADGFDCFEFVCEDGTVLQGLRREGAEDETNGTLTEIRTESADHATYRGACVGMPLDKFLALYPEAIRRLNTEPSDHSYTYSSQDPGFNQIVFWFESDVLSAFTIANGIDGYLY